MSVQINGINYALATLACLGLAEPRWNGGLSIVNTNDPQIIKNFPFAKL